MTEKLKPLPPTQTLGYRILDWCRANLIQPDGEHQGEPFTFTDEQAAFVTHFYGVDDAGRFTFRRAVLSRPKGWGKSPLLAALCCAELLGPVVYAGRDASGEPIGRPQPSPLVQLAAVSEDQTANTYDLVKEMLTGPAERNHPGLDVGLTRVYSATGKLVQVTSNSKSREGQRTTFAVLDETHLWNPSNGGDRLAAVIRRNLAKMDGRSVETTNAFVPGEESVAERSAEAAQKAREGRLRRDGLLYDHVEPPFEVDKTNERSIRDALSFVYGDARAWINFDRIIDEIWDPATDPQDSDRFYFNMITHATDSWISQPEWLVCQDHEKMIEPGEVITLGFDGSRKRVRGVTDATALIGCRVSDGHLFQLAVWEQPEGPAGEGWEVPIIEVLAAVDDAFDQYSVVGFFADPAKWEGHVNTWEARYGPRLTVKASANHPIEWWMTGGRASLTVRALEILHNAIVDQEMTHDGSFALTRHVLNARRRVGRSGITIAKDHPSSPRKIDGAIAATLAFKARMDALASGVTEVKKKSRKLYRF
ncbi:terminase [Kitasatospora acidiphila]|uniref:Terminase n=1 Tax=Kitasatospora acidiphila TaxID=2567942 RepID=A0A540W4L0_9ACTN|nr:terminase [Kitasatospora acidiphila]TQF03922.1 terminase [Kitasatospora acidiphila]